MKPASAAAVEAIAIAGGRILDTKTTAPVQRRSLAFCEAPVLIDTELMRRALDDAKTADQRRKP